MEIDAAHRNTRDGHRLALRRLSVVLVLEESRSRLIYMPDQLGSVRDVLDGTTGSLVDALVGVVI